MLMAVKNQLRINRLTTKYALMREMLNKVSFIFNIIFMIINNACFLIEWVVLFSLKDNIGGYTIKEVILLWGLSSGIYGLSRFFFKKAFYLSETINDGKLDAFLVQPKNVLIQAISTDVEPSALGDMLYSLILYFIYGFTIKGFLLYILFTILGGFVITSIAIIVGSLSFWINKSENITNIINSSMLNFSTYPDGIFKGLVKVLLYTLIPVGITTYIPVSLLIEFKTQPFLLVVLISFFFIIFAYLIFNKGLKRYSSTNLMISRI